MAQSNKQRANVMEAMEEYSQNLTRKELSLSNNALREPAKAKTRHTTNAWKVEGSPANMRVGTGLPLMNSHGIIKRSVVIVKDATNIDSKILVWIGWTEFNFNPSLRAPRTADTILAISCGVDKLFWWW
ncbi:unnamed protein product [Camellia sinensis]